MKILELFSGNGDISKAFKERGHNVYRVDWSEDVDAELHSDIAKLTVKDIIKLCNGVPDIIWASPDCTTYSIATHRHRTLKEGLKPKTDYAAQCDDTNVAMWDLIEKLVMLGTKYYYVENPRGRMRHMPFIKGLYRNTISYCSYGNRGNVKGYEDQYTMKPTDIWTNNASTNFKPLCSQKNPPHIHGDWGVIKKRDYLSRGEMPKELCDHIAIVSEA